MGYNPNYKKPPLPNNNSNNPNNPNYKKPPLPNNNQKPTYKPSTDELSDREKKILAGGVGATIAAGLGTRLYNKHKNKVLDKKEEKISVVKPKEENVPIIEPAGRKTKVKTIKIEEEPKKPVTLYDKIKKELTGKQKAKAELEAKLKANKEALEKTEDSTDDLRDKAFHAAKAMGKEETFLSKITPHKWYTKFLDEK